MKPDTSPDFGKPPLAETLLGVQFDPLAKLRLSHLFAFLHSRDIDSSAVLEGRALGQTTEPASKDEMWVGRTLRLDLSDTAPVRLLGRIKSPQGDRLVQVENGWLTYNWQGQVDGRPYPRFRKVRSEFQDWRKHLGGFLAKHGLGDLRPNLWEVAYINVIPRGPLWEDVHEWHEVLPGLFSQTPRVKCGPLQTAGGRWVFDLAPHKARLQVIVEHGRREVPKTEELLVLKLIARGRVADGRPKDLDAGLELGHQTIVHTFVEIASKKALKHWEYRK